MDHGSDAATIVMNATVDMTKGALQISATLLRQMLLLAREGSQMTAGETNINQLIKSLAVGDQIESATIPKADADQLARLSKKHGILYAMAQPEHSEDKIIVYYTASEAPRMKNLLEDLLVKRVQPEGKTEPKTAENPSDQREMQKESDAKAGRETEQQREDAEAAVLFSQNADPVKEEPEPEPEWKDETEVIFDVQNPQTWVELRQYSDGSSSCYLHFPDQEPIGPDAAELAAETVKRFGEPMTLRVGGHYDRELLQEKIHQFAEPRIQKQLHQQEQERRTEWIRSLVSGKPGLEETLHTIEDADHPNNRILIYKALSDTGEQTLQEITRYVVYLDGKQVPVSPEAALQNFREYHYTETTGPEAEKQFKRQEEIGDLASLQATMRDETKLIFDAQKPEAWIELRQYSDGRRTCFVSPSGEGAVDIEAVYLTNDTAKQFAEPVTLQIKGHYTQEQLQAEIKQFIDFRTEKQSLHQEQERRTEWIRSLVSEKPGLEETLHTIEDADHPNNRILIYKALSDTGEQTLQEITRYVVYLDGKQVPVSPEAALQNFREYHYTETTGPEAEKQFKRQEEIGDLASLQATMRDETKLIFDAQKPEAWIELRQYSDGRRTCFVSPSGEGAVDIEAVYLTNDTAKQFAEPVTLQIKGHYTQEQLQTKIHQIAEPRKQERFHQQEQERRTKWIQNLLQEKPTLEETLYTITDSANRSNRILIYKALEDTGGEKLQEVTKYLVYLDGKKASVSPEMALQSFKKYRYTEKTGSAAQKQFHKLEENDSVNWKKQRAERREGETTIKAIDESKKSLAQYQQEVALIRSLQKTSPSMNISELQKAAPVLERG